ncbi:AAA family ATPase [Candidatus Parcubacteria bacterium]|nr:AAA family ATPase [Candidatus Parcubacteria bacterium]
MTGFSYQPSLRLRQARLARLIRPIAGLMGPAAGLLTGAGLYLHLRSDPAGYLLAGAAIAILMLTLWYRWELSELPPGADLPADGGVVPLDQVVSADIVSLLPWPGTPRTLWLVLRRHRQAAFLVNRLGLDPDAIEASLPAEGSAEAVWQEAYRLACELRLPVIDAATLTAAALTAHPAGLASSFGGLVDPSDLRAALEWLERLIALGHPRRSAYSGGIGRDWAAGYTPVLGRYSRNLSADVESSGMTFATLAHGQTLEQMLVNLSRPSRSSVVLVGDPGVGKTALVYALAERLLHGGGALAYHQVVSLNAALLVSSNQQPGQLEQTMLELLADAVHAGNMIVFLDEAQLFFGAGVGAVDLSQILLPFLDSGRGRLILAMTPGDWQHLAGSNPAMAAQFNVVNVPESGSEEVKRILQDRALSLEYERGSILTYQALLEVQRLAERYIRDQALPGKALKLLEDAFGYPDGGRITPHSVQVAVEQTLGVKAAPAGAAEKAQLLHLEELLHKRMINQVRAVSVVAAALRRSRAGVGNPNRPVGSFLFLGPTGVGKTELTKALAEAYFGGRDQMIRVDMSEYAQPDDAARLLAASGEEGTGSNLLLQVRQHPFSVVLLDEIEKAHPDVLNLLLQMLDEGRLTDSNGREVSFKEAIIIVTSNAGADDIRRHIEAGESLEQFEEAIVNGLIDSHQFRPELINRFDEVVLFRPLTKEELERVVGLMLGEVNQTLAPQKITVSLTEAAVRHLVEAGYDPRLGARPMRRMVQKAVENTVANRILSGQAKPGDALVLDVGDLSA